MGINYVTFSPNITHHFYY